MTQSQIMPQKKEKAVYNNRLVKLDSHKITKKLLQCQ